MLDHITLRVSDVEASRRFYDTALAPLDLVAEFDEWGDLSISAQRDGSVTQRAHVGFAARSAEQVDAFWRAATEAGFRDNGAPGLRPQYHEAYYGAFVLDPDGNNIEAVHHGREQTQGTFDHAALRVTDLEASKHFYAAALEPLGFGVVHDEGGFVGLGVSGNSLWLLEGDPTRNVHVAFMAADNSTVDAFHRALVAAGFQDNGPPGERPVYHAGYYGAFVLDPDGNNVEAVCHNRD
jgi:catechol 2,3-dioxygenase-like lactoylglutathione lyase family enzyme